MASSTEVKYNAKQPVTLIVTRPCMTRSKEFEPLKSYKVGDEIVIPRQFGDELVSLNKAVVKGSPAHEAWTATRPKEEKKSKKGNE